MATRNEAALKIAQHPRVESAEWNECLYAVTLKQGWRDCGMTTGEHVIIDNKVSDVLRAVRAAVPCGCTERCVLVEQEGTGSEGHTCIDIDNSATGLPCEACRNE